MKVGRNDPCPCGSGNKFKKCHLGKTIPTLPPLDKHYFSLKGKVAEEIVQCLAEKTFLTDWCYRNPILKDGKELCDLLIVFGDVVIIWQIKNLKLSNDGKYKKAEVDKNLRQLTGARRNLFAQNKNIELVHPYRGKENFNPKSIKEVYLISALVGKEEDYSTFAEEFKNSTIHVFTREFTQIALNELDTISDFINYLRTKETLIDSDKEITIIGGEKELLAFYLMNGKSFERFNEATMIMIDEGSWEHLQQKPEYKKKKFADKISYGWDEIIKRAHETGVPEYEKVAREMAKLNRFERRYFSKGFLDAHIKAHNDKVHNNYRRIIFGDNITYCFLFMDDPSLKREWRKSVLFSMCYVARGKYPKNKIVLGIATEMKINPRASHDFCLFDKPSWSKKDDDQVALIQKETGLLVNPEMQMVHEDEYPSV